MDEQMIEQTILKWQKEPTDTDFQLVLSQFQPLINKLSNKYQGARDREDLKQIGQIALWQAMSSYNPEKAKFITHAYIFISGQLSIEFSRQTNFNKYMNRTHPDYKKPEFTEIDDYHKSFSKLDKEFKQIEFNELIQLVPARYQSIMLDKYKNGLNLKQIADKNLMTHEGVRQIIKKCLNMLKSHI